MLEEPYNNIVGTNSYNPCYTVFDRKKKEIYIYETKGVGGVWETWAKSFEENDDYTGKDFTIKVTKRVEREIYAEGLEHIVVYELQNDTLKKVSDTKTPY